MSAGVCLHGCPPPLVTIEHQSVERALMCLWVYGSIICVWVCWCVCVCVCLGEQEECALAAPPQPPHAWPPALGLESMRITRVTMEIHKHKYALGQQRTHTHTRMHRTASPLIACSIFNIFMVWEIMTLGAARTTRQMMFTFVLTDAVRCRRRDYELRVFRGFVFFVRVY